MLPKEITSLQHPLVKHLVKLRKERKVRWEENSVVIFGEKTVRERKRVKRLFIARGVSPPNALIYDEIFSVTLEIMSKISGHPKPEPFAAELPMPQPARLKGKEKLLALEGVQDPGNIGTLTRTALALGFEGLFLFANCADPFNDKALSAARGATFSLPYQTGTAKEFWQWVKEEKLSPYVGHIDGQPLRLAQFQKPLVLILGNETHGPTELTKAQGQCITIPTHDATDSLNVAIAGGILMYQINERLAHV